MIMNSPEFKLTEQHQRTMIWTLLGLMPIIGMAIDLIAPSLPAISIALQVSAHVSKDLISIYLLGYAFGNFCTGILTDALGRRKLLLWSLAGFTVISIGPIFFPSIQILLWVRLLQGVTLGAISVLVRAIFADILPTEKLIKLGPIIAAMWGIGPVLGPVIGGYLQYYVGWQAGFCFFTFMSLIGFLAIFFIVPETHLLLQPLRLQTIKNNLAEIVENKIFLAMVLLMGLTYALIIVFNTAGPFLIQTVLQHTPVFFGHLALMLGLVYLLATLLCRYFLKRHQVEQLLFISINFGFIVTLILFVFSYYYRTNINFIAIVCAVMFFACGFVFPLAMGKGISVFRHIAGTATATMYLLNVSITSAAAFFTSFIIVQNIISLMWIFVTLLTLCMLIYWLMIYRGQVNS